MKTTVNVYEAKTNLSKLLDMVANGQEVTIAKAGKPVADLTKHVPKKKPLKFGLLEGKLHYKDEDFMGIDPEIQALFYDKEDL